MFATIFCLFISWHLSSVYSCLLNCSPVFSSTKMQFNAIQLKFYYLNIWCLSPHIDIVLPFEPVSTPTYFSVPLCLIVCFNSSANLHIRPCSAWHGFACLPVVCASLPNPKFSAAFSFVCMPFVLKLSWYLLQWRSCSEMYVQIQSCNCSEVKSFDPRCSGLAPCSSVSLPTTMCHSSKLHENFKSCIMETAISYQVHRVHIALVLRPTCYTPFFL